MTRGRIEMATKTRPTRPTQLEVEWDFIGEYCSGFMRMHPAAQAADVRIFGTFEKKHAAKIKKLGKWLIRAAEYLEAR